MRVPVLLAFIACAAGSSEEVRFCLENDTRNPITGVYICETGFVDFEAAPVTPSSEVQDAFTAIDTLSSGAALFMGFDFDSEYEAECMPIAVAGMRHAFGRGIPVFLTSMSPEGGELIDRGLSIVTDPEQDLFYERVSWPEWSGILGTEIPSHDELVLAWAEAGHTLPENALGWVFEGRDYLALGYQPILSMSILGMAESIADWCPHDLSGNATANMPIVLEHRCLCPRDVILTCSAYDQSSQWITYGRDRVGASVVLAGSSILASYFAGDPISQGLSGIVSGLKGTGEYEHLLIEQDLYPSMGDGLRYLGEVHAVRYGNWGGNLLGAGETIPAGATHEFTLEDGTFDMRLEDDHGLLWLEKEMQITSPAASGVVGVFTRFLPVPAGEPD